MTRAHSPIRFGLIASALTLFAAVYVAGAQPYSLEFNQNETRWQVVLDGVMGGLSSGQVEATDQGVLFRGDLSLENNGGFSQIRTEIDEGSFAGADGIEIRVRGDGRSYIFDARVSGVRVMAGSFQHTFDTKRDEWTTIRLPFTGFKFHYFGRLMPNVGAIEQATINSVGITLADKESGNFELEIGAIRAYSEMDSARQARLDALNRTLGLAGFDEDDRVSAISDERASRLRQLSEKLIEGSAEAEQQRDMMPKVSDTFASHVMGVCELAIERGVPLFNQGQPGACASVYEVALSSILSLGRDDLSGDTRGMIHRAIRDGQHMHDANERAWHYRRAIDELMRSFRNRV